MQRANGRPEPIPLVDRVSDGVGPFGSEMAGDSEAALLVGVPIDGDAAAALLIGATSNASASATRALSFGRNFVGVIV